MAGLFLLNSVQVIFSVILFGNASTVSKNLFLPNPSLVLGPEATDTMAPENLDSCRPYLCLGNLVPILSYLCLGILGPIRPYLCLGILGPVHPYLCPGILGPSRPYL
jgi:hypothetical protein